MALAYLEQFCLVDHGHREILADRLVSRRGQKVLATLENLAGPVPKSDLVVLGILLVPATQFLGFLCRLVRRILRGPGYQHTLAARFVRLALAPQSDLDGLVQSIHRLHNPSSFVSSFFFFFKEKKSQSLASMSDECDCDACVGKDGPQGAAGYMGSGTGGSMGPQGAAGYMGSGTGGSMGPQGLTGAPNGSNPSGTQGPMGMPSPDDPLGFRGQQGPVGPQGREERGIQGIEGPQGMPLPGMQGTKGNKGPQGYDGAPVVGVAGFQGGGTNGPQGIIGPQGPSKAGSQGPIGIAGLPVLQTLIQTAEGTSSGEPVIFLHASPTVTSLASFTARAYLDTDAQGTLTMTQDSVILCQLHYQYPIWMRGEIQIALDGICIASGQPVFISFHSEPAGTFMNLMDAIFTYVQLQ